MLQKTDIQPIQNTSDKAASLFLIIEKLASGKSADPAKISELLNVWERVNALQAKADFDRAISEVKPQLPYIVKNNEVILNGGRGYAYEDLATISKSVDPVLAQYGLSYRFTTSSTPTTVTVTCKLSHSSGHSEENSLTASLDKSGSKNDIQALGSSVSYLSRYTLKASLGLAAGKDNDANIAVEATKTDTINAIQLEALKKLIQVKDVDVNDIYKHYKVSDLSELLVGQYEQAIVHLNNPKRTIKVVAQRQGAPA